MLEPSDRKVTFPPVSTNHDVQPIYLYLLSPTGVRSHPDYPEPSPRTTHLEFWVTLTLPLGPRILRRGSASEWQLKVGPSVDSLLS